VSKMTSSFRQLADEQLANISCSPRPARPRIANRCIRLIRPTSLRRAFRTSAIPLTFAIITLCAYWMHSTNALESFLTVAGRESRNLMVSSGLTVKDVIVTGRRHAGYNNIMDALDAARGDLVFDVDLEVARQRIEGLGWIRAATVRRYFPGTILINVVERRPFALWQRRGRVSLIDREGQVIGSEALAKFVTLPVIVGDDAPRHVGTLVSVLSRQPMLLTQLDAASRVSDRRWDIRLSNGLEIKLPEQGVAAAWDLLATLVMEHQLLERDVIAIDLRVMDRLAIRLGPASAATHRGEGQST
jgi:cell division protein FtsQ